MKKSGVSTKCVHSGDLIDDKFKGATSPIFPAKIIAIKPHITVNHFEALK